MLPRSAFRNASITSFPFARVNSPVWLLMIRTPGCFAIASAKPFLRSIAGAEPVVPSSSTTLPLPQSFFASHSPAIRPSSTKSLAISVT